MKFKSLDIIECKLIIDADAYSVGEGCLIDMPFAEHWTDADIDKHMQQYDGKTVFIINGQTVVSSSGVFLGTYYS